MIVRGKARSHYVRIIVHPNSRARVADIEAIRTAGRARAGAQSALRVSHDVNVSF